MLKRAFQVAKVEDRAITRLSAHASLDEADRARIVDATAGAVFIPARTELASETTSPCAPRLLLNGWIAQQRTLPDGRRQIVGFTLPGELFGRFGDRPNVSLSARVTVTDVLACAAPPASKGSGLERAYKGERLAGRLQLVDQITRLGRMDAKEKLCDFLLDIWERLVVSGEASGASFDMPLTQECLSDALGISPVHFNRTLQSCRRDREISWVDGRVTIADPCALAQRVGRKPFRLFPLFQKEMSAGGI